jgi:hypothetical protein
MRAKQHLPPVYVCEPCDLEFPTTSLFNTHLLSDDHQKHIEHPCHQCDKTFSSEAVLASHITKKYSSLWGLPAKTGMAPPDDLLQFTAVSHTEDVAKQNEVWKNEATENHQHIADMYEIMGANTDLVAGNGEADEGKYGIYEEEFEHDVGALDLDLDERGPDGDSFALHEDSYVPEECAPKDCGHEKNRPDEAYGVEGYYGRDEYNGVEGEYDTGESYASEEYDRKDCHHPEQEYDPNVDHGPEEPCPNVSYDQEEEFCPEGEHGRKEEKHSNEVEYKHEEQIAELGEQNHRPGGMNDKPGDANDDFEAEKMKDGSSGHYDAFRGALN